MVESDTIQKYNCDKCKDETSYLVVCDGIEYWIPCECRRQHKIARLMSSSEITEEFKKLNFESFAIANKPKLIKESFDCAKEYLEIFEEIKGKRQNSIMFLGNPGTGKTHLLTAISNKLIAEHAVAVLYFPYVEGFNDLKDNFDKLETKLRRMKTVEVLFIDDLFKPTRGIPRATEWQVEQMYAVINHRYLNKLPIMVSSELTIDQLCNVDEALGSRIYEMCRDYTVEILGDRKLLNHRLVGG